MDLHALTIQTLQTYLDKAAQIWGRVFPMPSVSFDLRGRTAGYATYGNNHIKLNLELFSRNVDHFVKDTIPHELAHLLAYQVYGRAVMGRPHGPQWKNVMLHLGLVPVRCHNLETIVARKVRKFRYVCSCQKFALGPLRHKKIQRGALFTCRKCKTKLVFLNEILD